MALFHKASVVLKYQTKMISRYDFYIGPIKINISFHNSSFVLLKRNRDILDVQVSIYFHRWTSLLQPTTQRCRDAAAKRNKGPIVYPHSLLFSTTILDMDYTRGRY